MSSKLKSWRLAQGLSVAALARQLSISRQSLHRLESGLVAPRRATADRIQAITGLSRADILSPPPCLPGSTATEVRHDA